MQLLNELLMNHDVCCLYLLLLLLDLRNLKVLPTGTIYNLIVPLAITFLPWTSSIMLISSFITFIRPTPIYGKPDSRTQKEKIVIGDRYISNGSTDRNCNLFISYIHAHMYSLGVEGDIQILGASWDLSRWWLLRGPCILLPRLSDTSSDLLV